MIEPYFETAVFKTNEQAFYHDYPWQRMPEIINKYVHFHYFLNLALNRTGNFLVRQQNK